MDIAGQPGGLHEFNPVCSLKLQAPGKCVDDFLSRWPVSPLEFGDIALAYPRFFPQVFLGQPKAGRDARRGLS